MSLGFLAPIAAGPISHTTTGYIIIAMIVGIAVVLRLLRGRRR